MKNLIWIPTLFLFIACEKNNKNPDPTSEPDCDCDRVVQVNSFTSIGDCVSTSGTHIFGQVITINDCTQIQINGNWSQCEGDALPVVGECFVH